MSTALVLSGVRAAKKLIHFTEQAWHAVDPAPFVPGWHIEVICEHLEALYRLQIRNLLITVPPRHSKRIDVNEPVPTPSGWKLHGDLKSGDYVFGWDGRPIQVLGVTPRTVASSRRLKFADGSSVVASGDHLWRTERTWHTGRGPRTGWERNDRGLVVPMGDLPPVTTDFIAETLKENGRLHAKWTHRVCNTRPLFLPEAELPIPPYTLGAWLGDGSSGQGDIHGIDHGVFERVRHDGYEVALHKPDRPGHPDFRRGRVVGLTTELRCAGLINNKHIPQNYLRSSIQQRRDLLAGLLDTDGHHITARNSAGRYGIAQKSDAIADGIMELLWSLGFAPRRVKINTAIGDRDYGQANFIQFALQPDDPDAAYLSRKQWTDRQGTGGRRGMLRRTVVSAEPVGDREVSCIEVDSPDSMYLVGRGFVPTHNTLITSIIFPAWVWVRSPGTKFLCASYSSNLSLDHARSSRKLIMSPWYQSRFHWVQLQASGEEHFTNSANGARITSSVGGTVTGRGGDILCFPGDEIVWTEHGPIRFDEVVGRQLKVKAWSVNLATGQTELKPIVGWHRNPGSPIVRVTLSDGASFRCTPDHRIWTENRGWVEAQELRSDDRLPVPNLDDAPDSSVESFGECPIAAKMEPAPYLGLNSGGENDAHCSPPLAANSVCGGRWPGDSLLDGRDGTGVDTETVSEHRAPFTAFVYLDRLRCSQLGVLVPLSAALVAVQSDILRCRCPGSPLPNAVYGAEPHAVSFCQDAGVFFTRGYPADLLSRQYWASCTRSRAFGCPSFFRRVPPSLPPSNEIDGRYRDVMTDGGFDGCLVGFDDCDRVLGGQASISTCLGVVTAMSSCVLSVLAPGSVDQVREAVVGRDAVEMPDIEAFGLRADESPHDDLMHASHRHFTLAGESYPQVAIRVKTWIQDTRSEVNRHATSLDGSGFTTNTPLVRDAVVGPLRDRSPVLVEFVGHADASFCLTVENNHNMIVGGESSSGIGILVKNCLDDPHNLREIHVPHARQKVINWYVTVWHNRVNDPRTGRRLCIMQRGHDKDLAGAMLSDFGYTHLNLPMEYSKTLSKPSPLSKNPDRRQKEGEILAPARFSKKDVEELRSVQGGAYEAYYQQNPLPDEGLVFKSEWLDVVEKPPPVRVQNRVRFWDMAASDAEVSHDRDYTAGVLVHAYENGTYVIMDVVRGRWSPANAENVIRRTAIIDGPETLIREEEEPGSSGKTVIVLRGRVLAGFNYRGVRPTGSKFTRWIPLAQHFEQKKVTILKAAWNRAFIDEMASVPHGAHDDQADAASGAFASALEMKRVFGAGNFASPL